MKKIEHKVAIITGAGSGIGRAAALLLAQNGVKVVVSDINESHGHQVVNEIKSMGADALFIKADTSRASDHEMLVNKTIEVFGRLDIAINNAGIVIL